MSESFGSQLNLVVRDGQDSLFWRNATQQTGEQDQYRLSVDRIHKRKITLHAWRQVALLFFRFTSTFPPERGGVLTDRKTDKFVYIVFMEYYVIRWIYYGYRWISSRWSVIVQSSILHSIIPAQVLPASTLFIKIRGYFKVNMKNMIEKKKHLILLFCFAFSCFLMSLLNKKNQMLLLKPLFLFVCFVIWKRR